MTKKVSLLPLFTHRNRKRSSYDIGISLEQVYSQSSAPESLSRTYHLLLSRLLMLMSILPLPRCLLLFSGGCYRFPDACAIQWDILSNTNSATSFVTLCLYRLPRTYLHNITKSLVLARHHKQITPTHILFYFQMNCLPYWLFGDCPPVCDEGLLP